jgi:hypothetical protein
MTAFDAAVGPTRTVANVSRRPAPPPNLPPENPSDSTTMRSESLGVARSPVPVLLAPAEPSASRER